MEYKRCPSCGSIYFVVYRGSQKCIIHVDENDQPVALSEESACHKVSLDGEEIHCGACSWKGTLTELALPL